MQKKAPMEPSPEISKRPDGRTRNLTEMPVHCPTNFADWLLPILTQTQLGFRLKSLKSSGKVIKKGDLLIINS